MVCLDTSFLVDLLRGKEDVRTMLDILQERAEEMSVATPSIMELSKGASLGNNPLEEKEKIQRLFSSLLVLNFDRECAVKAGEIEADLRKKGQMIEIEDIMIAAIALQHGESLVTRNIKHFEKIEGLKIERY